MPVTHEVAGSSPVHPAIISKLNKGTRREFRASLSCNNTQFEIDNFQPKVVQNHPSVAKSVAFLTPKDVAEELSVDKATILRWCKSGKLPAIPKPYGKRITYQIYPSALALIQSKPETIKRIKPKNQDVSLYINKWCKALLNGYGNNKPFSKVTVDDYHRYIKLYSLKYTSIHSNYLESELAKIKPHQFSKRDHYYKAVLCFAKYLIHIDQLDSDVIEKLNKLKPKRSTPPKRTTINPEGLQKILEACQSDQDMLIITLLAKTGLRASEACSVAWDDIDLDKGYLLVRNGKGNKPRKVGLCSELIELLRGHVRVNRQYLLADKHGKPMTRHGLYARLKRIGKNGGVTVTPHALRRAFVTINANKGRPLQMLQKACGHSDIKTTMGYCLTSEQEVIEAMQGWD